MATTPDSYGRFIGRVGALALALGIGAAVANSPGIAVAEDGGAGASHTDTTAGPSDAGSEATHDDGAGAKDAGNQPQSDETRSDETAAEDFEAPKEIEEIEDIEDIEDDPEGADETPNDHEEGLASSDERDEPGGSSHLDGDDDGLGLDGGSAVHDGFTAALHMTSDSVVQDDDTVAEQFGTPTEAEHPGSETEVGSATAQAAETTTFATFTTFSAESPDPSATSTTTGLGGLVSGFLSVLGLGPKAVSAPVAPPQPPMLWAMLGWVRREIGRVVAPFVGNGTTSVAALLADDVSATAVSPLATPEQLAAERLAARTANTLPVALMKIFLRQGFLNAAKQQYPQGLDEGSLAALDNAVNEYAMAAAFQQQLLNSMTPTVVTQVAPPHIWFGQNVPGSRILYDNPDTIYNFMGVNGASEYVITGQFHNYSNPDARPSDTTFSVLEGVGGTTSTILTVDENFVVDEDGRFVITVSREPANGRPNHLQLTAGSTIIAARNTLGDWSVEEPMSLSIERVGGPPNSLFAQIGGFAFLGQQVAGNPLLTTLVSLVPPLPFMPPTLRGVFTAAILVVRGVNEQSKYMALASTDPQTGQPRPANVLSQPASNAEFLANQLQSTGHFQLADDEALVLRIDPGSAGYFIVPTYNIWTITGDYWNQQTSLNNAQAVDEDGIYTIVISPTDPGVTNWVSTGGLHQGTISVRFQNLAPDPDNENPPRILSQMVIPVNEAKNLFPDDPRFFVDREEQLAARKAGYDKRWAPYPQP